MKRVPFKLVAGLMIAAIIGLVVIAAGLALAILDEEVSLRRSETPWPTATTRHQTFPTLTASPIPVKTETPALPSPLPIMIPTLAPGQETLPSVHPEVGPNQPPCNDCHLPIHGSGG